MKIDHLIAQNVQPKLLDIWRKTVGERLLPVQERAVREYGLLGDRNLIVFSPTSSGKTFVGEMAAVQAARQSRKVFYLVPLKALAEEKFRELRQRYESLGIRVIVSSRDHAEYDADLLSLNFSIAVVVYEKLQSFLVSHPAIVERTGLVVADELQLITDPTRGPALELLLTKLITAKRRPRLVGLSAVLGHAEELAKWLEADLLVDRKRPLELRKGVLCRGEFRYREHNSGQLGSEAFPNIGDGASPDDVKLAAIEHLVRKGEQVLVFEMTRISSVGTARKLANRLQLPMATEALETLADHDETEASRHLRTALESSVAFHNADLTPEERSLVERHFIAGDIRVVCATPTLAMGMNLPTKNVFVPAEKWVYLKRYRDWTTDELSKSEYENMSGRAGRYSLTEGFGRSILVTSSPFDADNWMERFVDADFEDIEPTLKDTSLAVHVLDLLVSDLVSTREEIAELLLRSFTGQSYWQQALGKGQFGEELDQAIRDCRIMGMLNEVRDPNGTDRLVPTQLGTAAANTGLRLETAAVLARWLRDTEALTIEPLDVLTALAYTADGDECYIPCRMREPSIRGYRERLLKTAKERGLLDRPFIRSVHQSRFALTEEAAKRVKKVLLLDAWMNEEPLGVIEQSFDVWAGAVRRVAEEFAWLAEALAKVAGALAWSNAQQRALRNLSRRIGKGIQSDLVPIAGLPVRGLGRVYLRRLADAGLADVRALKTATPDQLRAALNHRGLAERLHGHLHKSEDDTEDGATGEAEPGSEGASAGTHPELATDSAQPPVEAAACRAAETSPTYGAGGQTSMHSVYFIGTCSRRRYLMRIDDQEVWVPNQPFRILWLLATQRRRDPAGWVHTSGLGLSSDPYRAISRVRRLLSLHARSERSSWIENDGHGSYRLDTQVHVGWDEDGLRAEHADLLQHLDRADNRRANR